MTSSRFVTLSNGIQMPIVGFGTSRCQKDQLVEAVKAAIDAGYRHFDCAYVYNNEEGVGEGIRYKINEGKVKREDLFIVSKLWRAFNRPEHMDECMNISLKRSGLEYFDLYLMHYPQAGAYAGPGEAFLRNEKNEVILDEEIDYVDTWKAMQRFVKDGRARMLGVSNFNLYQIKRLIKETEIIPLINQIEVHPYLDNRKIIRYCHEQNIHVTAFCCIGASDRATDKNLPLLLKDPVLAKIAQKHTKSPAQIAIKYCIQQNIIAIPKSVTPSRIIENISVFDFTLDEEDMAELVGLNINFRYQPSSFDHHHRFYPYRENYSE